jgi:hypothetical protein
MRKNTEERKRMNADILILCVFTALVVFTIGFGGGLRG